jgi:hypothetical protein
LVGIDLTIQSLQSEKVGNARHELNYRPKVGKSTSIGFGLTGLFPGGTIRTVIHSEE